MRAVGSCGRTAAEGAASPSSGLRHSGQAALNNSYLARFLKQLLQRPWLHGSVSQVSLCTFNTAQPLSLNTIAGSASRLPAISLHLMGDFPKQLLQRPRVLGSVTQTALSTLNPSLSLSPLSLSLSLSLSLLSCKCKFCRVKPCKAQQHMSILPTASLALTAWQCPSNPYAHSTHVNHDA